MGKQNYVIGEQMSPKTTFTTIISASHIQLLEYAIPTAAAPAAAAPTPLKSPLCYGVSHVMVLACVMVLAMLWC